MNAQEIEVTISPDGIVHLHVRGVEGPACLDVTSGLEQALGGIVEERSHTSDFYDVPGRTGSVTTRKQISR